MDDGDGGGNVIVLASIVRAVDGEPQGWLTIKYDTNGNLLWANNLPGPFHGAIRVEVDALNNIYVAGYMWLTNVELARRLNQRDQVYVERCHSTA